MMYLIAYSVLNLANMFEIVIYYVEQISCYQKKHIMSLCYFLFHLMLENSYGFTLICILEIRKLLEDFCMPFRGIYHSVVFSFFNFQHCRYQAFLMLARLTIPQVQGNMENQQRK